MPRDEIPVIDITRQGGAAQAETVPVPANDMFFQNDGRVFLEVRNSTAGALTFDVEIPGNLDGDILNPDRTESVPANQTEKFGPFPPGVYNQPNSGIVHVNTAVATLLFRAYRLP